MFLADNREILCPLWVFFQEKIASELPQTKLYIIMFFATEHENVGKYLSMAMLVYPRSVYFLDALHTIKAESLIHLRLNLVATHILVVIHQKERFDNTVGNRMAMRTGIAYKAKHLLIFDGMRNDFHIINICLLFCRAYTMRKVVGTVELCTQLVHHIATVARHKQHIIYSTHFGIGELKGLRQIGEERRTAVDVILVALLEKDKPCRLYKIEQIIDLPTRDIHFFAQFNGRVAYRIGKQQNKLKFVLKFGIAHRTKIEKLHFKINTQFFGRKQGEGFTMIGRNAILLNGCTVFLGRITFVRLPIVLRKLFGNRFHIIVAIGFCED